MKRFFSFATLSSTLLLTTAAALAAPADSTSFAPATGAAQADISAPLFEPKGAWLGLALDTWREVCEMRTTYPLSTDQKTAIKAIMANYHDDIVLQLEARVKAQRALHAEVISPSADEAQVRLAAQKLGAVIADGAVLKSKIAREIRPLLTEDQRAALTRLMADLDTKVDSLLAATL